MSGSLHMISVHFLPIFMSSMNAGPRSIPVGSDAIMLL